VDGPQGTRGACRGFVPDLGDLAVQGVRLAMQRLGVDHSDESLDRAVVDVRRLDPVSAGVACQPREAEVRPPCGKLGEQLRPAGA
jgi:hypothetical protein